MISDVIHTIETERLLDGVRTVCVGVSGGADSMCLLDVLLTLQARYALDLQVVHVHHGLRGAQADRDAAFVAAFCASRGVPCSVVHADVRAVARATGVSVEEAGRNVRYTAFFNTGCDAVAVAHTLSDRIETALFHLARGTALRGAAGIPAKRERVIRPLLGVTRDAVEAYLSSRGISWVNDSSNDTDDFSRNYIRHHIIPAFKVQNPAFEQNVSHFLNTARRQSDYLRAAAQQLLQTAKTPDGYDKTALLAAHPALKEEALLCLLSDAMKKQPTRTHLALCETALEQNGSVQLGADLFFFADGERVCVSPRPAAFSAWSVPFDGHAAVTPVGVVRCVPAADKTAALSPEKLQGCCRLRSRCAGDVFSDPRRGVSKPLKKLFNEAHIPPQDRNRVVVLDVDGQVAWVEGFGADKRFAAADGADAVTLIVEPPGA